MYLLPTQSEKPTNWRGQSPCSKLIFEEAMDSSEVRVYNGLAQVWAHYKARFVESGKLDHWESIDAFSLLLLEGKWRIVRYPTLQKLLDGMVQASAGVTCRPSWAAFFLRNSI